MFARLSAIDTISCLQPCGAVPPCTPLRSRLETDAKRPERIGMTTVLFTIGAVVAAALLGLLVLTLLFRPFRIWPTPGSGSWQSYVFWPLFRSLNVLCFAVAMADRDELPRPSCVVCGLSPSRCSRRRLRSSSIRSGCWAGTTATARRTDWSPAGSIAGPAIRRTRCSSLSTAASRSPPTVRRPTCFARP